MIEIRPQPRQEDFLASKADIVFFGGSGGAGKSYALLLAPLLHITRTKDFGATIFRAQSTQIHSVGGLWDTSEELYPLLNAEPIRHRNEWIFPPYTNRVKFTHLTDRDLLGYQGSQIALILFDEVTHFSRKTFMYMLSRNRSMSGIRPRIKATFNPVPKTDPFAGWIHEWVSWYLDEDGRYPDYSKSGVLRYFIVRDDTLIWRDNKEDFEPSDNPLSFTFIPAKLSDNQKLIDQDPMYQAKLEALNSVDRARLLDSDFLIEDKSGEYFKREWFDIVKSYPKKCKLVAYYDKAASPKPDADMSAMLLLGSYEDTYYVIDTVSGRWNPSDREAVMRQTAILWKQKYGHIKYYVETEGGASGIESTNHTIRKTFKGFSCTGDRPSGSKETRAEPVMSQCAIKNVKLVEGDWNEDFIRTMVRFPRRPRDLVDCLSGAFNYLTKRGARVLF